MENSWLNTADTSLKTMNVVLLHIADWTACCYWLTIRSHAGQRDSLQSAWCWWEREKNKGMLARKLSQIKTNLSRVTSVKPLDKVYCIDCFSFPLVALNPAKGTVSLCPSARYIASIASLFHWLLWTQPRVQWVCVPQQVKLLQFLVATNGGLGR